MTQPTIEQMLAFLDNTMLQVEDESYAMKHLQNIRAYIEQASSSTLPLDEMPEGWELAFISHGKFGDGATFSAQIRRIVSHTVRYAYGATPAEALRAAIVKVKL